MAVVVLAAIAAVAFAALVLNTLMVLVLLRSRIVFSLQNLLYIHLAGANGVFSFTALLQLLMLAWIPAAVPSSTLGPEPQVLRATASLSAASQSTVAANVTYTAAYTAQCQSMGIVMHIAQTLSLCSLVAIARHHHLSYFAAAQSSRSAHTSMLRPNARPRPTIASVIAAQLAIFAKCLPCMFQSRAISWISSIWTVALAKALLPLAVSANAYSEPLNQDVFCSLAYIDAGGSHLTTNAVADAVVWSGMAACMAWFYFYSTSHPSAVSKSHGSVQLPLTPNSPFPSPAQINAHQGMPAMTPSGSQSRMPSSSTVHGSASALGGSLTPPPSRSASPTNPTHRNVHGYHQSLQPGQYDAHDDQPRQPRASRSMDALSLNTFQQPPSPAGPPSASGLLTPWGDGPHMGSMPVGLNRSSDALNSSAPDHETIMHNRLSLMQNARSALRLSTPGIVLLVFKALQAISAAQGYQGMQSRSRPPSHLEWLGECFASVTRDPLAGTLYTLMTVVAFFVLNRRIRRAMFALVGRAVKSPLRSPGSATSSSYSPASPSTPTSPLKSYASQSGSQSILSSATMRALDMNAAPLSKAAKDQQTLGGSQSLRKSNSALQPIATISVKPVTPQQLRQTQSSVSPATATLSAGQPSPTKTAAEAIEINQHHYRAISNTISNTSSYARGSRSPSATPAGAQDQQAWHHPAAVPINSAMHPSDERMSSQSAALTQSAHQQQQPVSILVTMPSFVSALPSSALPPHAPSSSFPLLPTTTRSGTHSGTHSRAHSGTHSLQSSAHSTQSYTGHSGTGRQGPMPETHVSGNPPDGGSARRNMRHNAAGSHSIDGLDSA